MIIDSSAILAILRGEPERDTCLEAITSAAGRRISAATYLEAGIVIDSSREPVASRRLDQFLLEADIGIEPVTEEQAKMARQAYTDFGKGSGHPARLNFGDCFAYALAKATGERLLYKGDDFTHTDVESALKPS